MATRQVTSSSHILPSLVTGKYSVVQTIKSCTTRERRFVSVVAASSQSFDFSDNGGIFPRRLTPDKPSSVR
jgi:hypothetical protein